MRYLLLFVCSMLFAMPAAAQSLATADVTARVRIPEFLSMRMVDATAVSATARRVVVQVTANNAWQLSVGGAEQAQCKVQMTSGDAVGDRVAGRGGNDMQVVIEYECAAPPEPGALRYELTPG